MRILYIHQYFKTPKEGGSIRSYYLARALVNHGHEVEMITAHDHSQNLVKDISGITVHYLPVSYHNSMGFLRRLMAFGRFYFLALKKGQSLAPFDIIYAMSTPLSVGVLALRLKAILKVPYYFEVGDLWPEAPIQMGYVRNRHLIRFLYKVEKAIYLNAEKIVALSPSIRNQILQVAPSKKVHLIPNLADTEFFSFTQKSIKLDKFSIAYIGAAGKANQLDYLLDIAVECQLRISEVNFKIMAAGGDLDNLRARCQLEKITNVEFLPYGSKSDVRTLLEDCEAVYVSFASYPILSTGSPNKFFDALAAGKLVILNFQGWLKEIVDLHKVGFTYSPEDPETFVSQLINYLNDPKKLESEQRNARVLAEQYFSRTILEPQFLEIFDPEKNVGISDYEPHILIA